MGALSATQQTVYDALKKAIRIGLDSAFKIGEALIRVRDEKLYQDEYVSFKEFCESEYNLAEQRAYQFIDATKIRAALPPKTQQLLSNESQARQLKSVEPSQRSAVLREASKEGPATAAKIAEVAAELAEPDTHELDHVGRVIPKSILEDWNRAKETARLFTNQVSRIKCAVEDGLAKETRDVVYAEVGNSLIAALKNCYSDLGLIEPWAVCPKCHGKTRATCTTCSKRGFISEFYWKRKIDSKTKALIEGNAKK